MSPRAKNRILARRDRQRAPAPNVRLLHRPPCEQCPRDTDYCKNDLLWNLLEPNEWEETNVGVRYGR